MPNKYYEFLGIWFMAGKEEKAHSFRMMFNHDPIEKKLRGKGSDRERNAEITGRMQGTSIDIEGDYYDRKRKKPKDIYEIKLNRLGHSDIFTGIRKGREGKGIVRGRLIELTDDEETRLAYEAYIRSKPEREKRHH